MFGFIPVERVLRIYDWCISPTVREGSDRIGCRNALQDITDPSGSLMFLAALGV
jgi:hypothetical protein